MTYTIYIPDIKNGTATYTQRQFESIKALARWAMEAALEEPAAPAVQGVATGTSGTIVLPESALPQSHAGQTISFDTCIKATPIAEPDWEINTDEWFTDVATSDWANPLRERNWEKVAGMYFDELKHLFYKIPVRDRATPVASIVSREDLVWFNRLAYTYPHLFAENLFPETQVRWDMLPTKFMDACVKVSEKRIVLSPPTTAVHRFAKDAFAILAFLRKGQRHQSWEEIPRNGELGLAWDSTSAEKTAEALLTKWWSGAKPTDAVREFILRTVILRYFKQSTTASTVGSAEFLSAYTDRVRRMGIDDILPAGFLDWATRGTSFKHCKAALSSLGIASVRRADGQKYTNLAEIKNEEDEIWVFEDTLGAYDSEHNFAPFNE